MQYKSCFSQDLEHLGGPAGSEGADLVADNAAQCCTELISHSGGCADGSHPARLSHAYHASPLREAGAPIPGFVQELWDLTQHTQSGSRAISLHTVQLKAAGLMLGCQASVVCNNDHCSS